MFNRIQGSVQDPSPFNCLGLDTISIGLRTTEESRPSDSSTAVITLRFLTIYLFSTHTVLSDMHHGLQLADV